MNTPQVCIRCRHRALLQRLCTRKPRDLSGRSFISLSSAGKLESHETPLPSPTEQTKSLNPNARHGAQPQSQGPSIHPSEPPESVNGMLERLFESTRRVDLPPSLHINRYSKTINPEFVEVIDHQRQWEIDIGTLKRFMEARTSTVHILRIMQTLPTYKDEKHHVVSHEGRHQRSKAWGRVLYPLLHRVISEHISGQQHPSSPTVTGVIRIYLSHDLMLRSWWSRTMWRLLRHILQEYGTIPSQKSKNTYHLLAEVLNIWKLFTKTYGVASAHSSTAIVSSPENTLMEDDVTPLPPTFIQPPTGCEDPQEWTGIPGPSAMIFTANFRPGFVECFYNFFTINTTPFSPNSIAIAAAITCLCVRSADNGSPMAPPIVTTAKPFLDFILRVVKIGYANELEFCTQFKACLINKEKAIVDTLYDDWTNLRMERQLLQDTKQLENSLPVSQSEHLKPRLQTRARTGPPSVRSGDVRKAARLKDLKFAMKLWDRQLRELASGTTCDAVIFVDFLTTFFALGSSDRATEVWNVMKKYGYNPDRRHWLALLDGCRASQDLESLNAVWQRMNAAKVELTNQAWTIYIKGLMFCKDWPTALRVVHEMVQLRNSSSKPSVDIGRENCSEDESPATTEFGQLMPTIVPINAALSGLIKNGKQDLAEEVLNWALSQNIKPDTATLNILVQPAVRSDDAARVRRLLYSMKQHGCSPDVYTFTIFLDGLFRNPSSAFHTESPEGQQALISTAFKDMEENGIQASPHTYSIIIDSLLTTSSPNIEAARAVMTRMTEQGIKPSPHIYTILVTHYFSSKPPDLPKIDSLWRYLQAEQTPLDHVFYDRMIEGYGRAGAVDQLLVVLRLMPHAGHTPGWLALLGALEALVRAQEWDLAKDLVRDVLDEEKGLLRLRKRGWRGEKEFWELVEELRERGIDMPRAVEDRDVNVDLQIDQKGAVSAI